jgi:hypothetical protein
MQPRKPTEQEKRELAEYVIENKYRDPSEDERQDEMDAVDNNAYIAVFDDYITGSPGYSGKVMTVVWDGSPSFTETYIWERHTLPDEEHTSLGQIDWHDGKHEPKLEKVENEDAYALADSVMEKRMEEMINAFQEVARIACLPTELHMARHKLRSDIIALKFATKQD